MSHLRTNSKQFQKTEDGKDVEADSTDADAGITDDHDDDGDNALHFNYDRGKMTRWSLSARSSRLCITHVLESGLNTFLIRISTVLSMHPFAHSSF